MPLIMGSEDEGISPENLKMCNHEVKIPLQGDIASLNVSAAASILLFEVVKNLPIFTRELNLLIITSGLNFLYLLVALLTFEYVLED